MYIFIDSLCVQPQDAKRKRQLAKAWEAEFVRKCQPMEPKVIGCLWISISSPEKILPKEEAFLMQFAAVALSALPIPVPVASKGESSTERSETQGLFVCIINNYITIKI